MYSVQHMKQGEWVEIVPPECSTIDEAQHQIDRFRSRQVHWQAGRYRIVPDGREDEAIET